MKYIQGELKFDADPTARKNHLGHLKADAIVSKVGILKYYDGFGNIRKEFVSRDELLKADSLSSLENIPVTNLHPVSGDRNVLLNAENTAKYQKGLSIGKPEHFDQNNITFVKIPVIITDQETITDIETGKKQQVSLGYTSQDIKTDGMWQGEKYDYIQTNRLYNHIAIVPAGRAGNDVRIKLDQDNLSVKFDYCDQENIKSDNKIINDKEVKSKMALIKIDGKDFEVSESAEILINQKFKNDSEKINSLENEKTDLQKQVDSLQAKLDESQDKLKKIDSFDYIGEAKKRIEFENSVINLLDKDYKFDNKSDTEIKKDVLAKLKPGLDLAEKSDDYINARFDAAIEDQKEVIKNKKIDNALNIASHAIPKNDDKNILSGVFSKLAGENN